MSEFVKIPDETYEKIWGQFRMQVTGVFDFMRVDEKLPVRYVYGLGAFIPGAVDTIVALAEIACERVRGRDIPITLDYANHRIKKKKRKK